MTAAAKRRHGYMCAGSALVVSCFVARAESRKCAVFLHDIIVSRRQICAKFSDVQPHSLPEPLACRVQNTPHRVLSVPSGVLLRADGASCLVCVSFLTYRKPTAAAASRSSRVSRALPPERSSARARSGHVPFSPERRGAHEFVSTGFEPSPRSSCRGCPSFLILAPFHPLPTLPFPSSHLFCLAPPRRRCDTHRRYTGGSCSRAKLRALLALGSPSTSQWLLLRHPQETARRCFLPSFLFGAGAASSSSHYYAWCALRGSRARQCVFRPSRRNVVRPSSSFAAAADVDADDAARPVGPSLGDLRRRVRGTLRALSS